MAKSKGGRTGLITATKALALESQRKRLKALEALIRRRLATVVESFYDIGEALTEILKKKLYAVGEHTSLEAYLAATKLIGIAQAMKLGAGAVSVKGDEVRVVLTRTQAERAIARGE